MTDKLQPIKGMKDILPEEQRVYTHLINRSREIGGLYGYEEFTPPILEFINIFDRSLGEYSDVVSKEMYDFRDKGDRHVALRPEFTASVMRAVISNNLISNLPQKFFSAGPVFRYDRPQAGRQRQFYQINFENIGYSGPHHDAEVIELAVRLLEDFGVLEHVNLEINSLGSSEDRANYSRALQNYFEKYKNDLSQDSQKRLTANPLRILDSKDERDQKLLREAPKIEDSYSKESKIYFDQVLKFLDLLAISYIINNRLVRGLDYYRHTSFEFTTSKLGAQVTVLGGGRYDGLYDLMNKANLDLGQAPTLPAMGFAAGIERICLLSDLSFSRPTSVCVIPVDEDSLHDSLRLVSVLRSSNITAHLDADSKIAKRLKRAVNRGSTHAIFIGEDERNNDHYLIKDLNTGNQEKLSMIALMKFLKG